MKINRIYFHKRYNLGDKHGLSVEEARELCNSDKIINLPVYMYEHSGITISTKPFSCRFDSCQIGFIYVDKNEVREHFKVKKISKKILKKVTDMLENDVKEYDEYLQGNN